MGGVLINLYFPMSYDMNKAESDISQTQNHASLPDGVNKPNVTRLSNSTFPILSYSLTANTAQVDDHALRSSVQTEIVKQLKTVPGVANVQTFGGANDGYVITVRMKDLISHDMTMDDFNQSVTSSLPNWSQGNLANIKDSIPVKIESWDLTDQELGNLQIKNKQGKVVSVCGSRYLPFLGGRKNRIANKREGKCIN